MGYKVKLQKINRSANYTYCITLPVVLVEMAGLKKGEEMEWTVEDKNTFVLTRRSPVRIKTPQTQGRTNHCLMWAAWGAGIRVR